MEFDSDEEAHTAMLDMAEREYRQSFQLPELTVVANAGSGGFSIRRGHRPVEDGMAVKRGEIPTRATGPC